MQTGKADFPSQAPLGRTTWLAIGGLGVTQIIGWGSTYYLLTILGRPIADTLGIAPALASSGLSILLVLGALIGPFAGRLMDMHGARPAMAGGSLLAASGLVVLSQAQGPASFIAAWLVIGASAAFILYPAAFTALTQVTPLHARRAITLLTLPGGLASTVFWPLTTSLGSIMDWRSICLVYAALHVAICLPLHLSVIPPYSGAQAATRSAEDGMPQEGLPEAARPRAFLLFAVMLALNSMLVTGILNQFMGFMLELGQSHANAVIFGMIFGVSQLSARVVDMLSAHRTDALRTGVAVAMGFMLSLSVLLLSGASPLAGLLFAILLGASNGVLTIVRGTLVLQLFGVKGFGEKLGTITVAQGLAGATGPIVLSSLLTGAGGTAGALFCLALASGALVAMLALFRHVSRTRTT